MLVNPTLRNRKFGWRNVGLFCLAILALYFCYRLGLGAAKGGISRLFSTMAIIQSRVEPADSAVALAPADPEAHYTRGLSLVNANHLDEAVVELRRSIQLRPHHYYQWLDLGVTLDRIGDQEGALAALNESVRLAPVFAQPRWQLGNFLFRQGRYPEAFAQLRQAAENNPNLVNGMFTLAWVAGNGDLDAVEALVQPGKPQTYFLLAKFLSRNGHGSDATRCLQAAGEASDQWERDIVHEIVAQLLATQQFPEAYSVWISNHPKSGDPRGHLLNGNFVEPIPSNDPGFGWQFASSANVSVSIDPTGPTQSTRAIRLEFSGDSAPESQVIYQRVLLSPNTKYSLSFMAKTSELVSGGAPVVAVLAIGNDSSKILSRSDSLSRGTTDWRTYKVDFSTNDKTSAVVFTLLRLPCSQSPCPIFGKIWLSGFALTSG